MAKHVWLCNKFTPRTLRVVADVARAAFTLFPEFDDACRAVGYAMERRQQDSTYRWQFVLEGVTLSGRRALRGANAENYRLAGMTLLSAAAPHWGLDAGAPANAVGDRILENLAGGE